MPYLTEESKYWAKIWRLETTTPAQGGAPAFEADGEDNITPSGGYDNIQGKQLADRTRNLNVRLLTLENQLLHSRLTALENNGVGDIVTKAYYPANLFSLTDYAFDGVIWMRGQTLSRTTYSRLFAKVQHQLSEDGLFRPGDGSTTFQLADLRAEFLRAWDGGRGVDVSREFGSQQDCAIKRHQHPLETESGNPMYVHNDHLNTQPPPEDVEKGGRLGEFGQTEDDAQWYPWTGYFGDGETRPRNRAVLVCVRY